MARICFVTYEIHPTTWGGAGVLLHHAAVRLLEAGNDVIFLLDVPRVFFDQFQNKDRLQLPSSDSCRAYHVDEFCSDFDLESEIDDPFIRKSARFDHALRKLHEKEDLDFVEFFEYCGVGYHALVSKIFGIAHEDTIIGMRAHNSIELIDAHESTKVLDTSRSLLYALERGSLGRSETVLFPSRLYADHYYVERYRLKEEAIVVSEPPTQPFGRREEPRSPESRNEVIYFGRVFSFKGIELFVQAALAFLARNPSSELRFVLIGPDSRDSLEGSSYIAYLKALIPEEFSSRFDFTGHLDHETARERLANTRFAVFPNRFESFCYSLHEVYDAGVPIIANSIPAFQNVLKDEETAVFFDGSLQGLVVAMERLDGDPALLLRLSAAEPITEEPLGTFYSAPYAGVPIPAEPDASMLIQVVILVGPNCSEMSLEQTVRSVVGAMGPMDQVVLFREVDVRSSEIRSDPVRFTWLGEACTAETPDGIPVGVEALQTLDALCVVRAGDVIDRSYLDLCRTALGKTPLEIGFSGSWCRGPSGELDGIELDLAPELYPFENGGRLTRAVLRTARGKSLTELFDPALGRYGEIGYLWRIVAEVGCGCLIPAPLVETCEDSGDTIAPELLAYLVANADMETFGKRLAGVAVARESVVRERPDLSRTLSDEARTAIRGNAKRIDAIDVARNELNGTTLLRLALQKLRSKVLTSMGLSPPGKYR